MRDIRDDLKERLSLLRADRDELQAQLKSKLAQIDAYEQQLTGLLALEEARVTVAAPAAEIVEETAAPTPEPEETAQQINARFEADIVAVLDDGKAHGHAQIKAVMEANGWYAEKGALGRQIQGVLLTLKNRGIIDYVGERAWQKAKVKAASAA